MRNNKTQECKCGATTPNQYSCEMCTAIEIAKQVTNDALILKAVATWNEAHLFLANALLETNEKLLELEQENKLWEAKYNFMKDSAQQNGRERDALEKEIEEAPVAQLDLWGTWHWDSRTTPAGKYKLLGR